MTATMPGRTDGLVHSVGFYGSDDEFARTCAPFCVDGLEAGEATVVRVDDRKAELLRSTLGDGGGILFLSPDHQYRHPPGALASVFELLDRHADGGTKPIRLVGELPTLTGLSRDAWLRYEAAVNHLLRDRPVRALCPCDTRATPPSVQDEMRRSHHAVVTVDGRLEPNPGYEPPTTFLGGRGSPVRDPLEEDDPAVGLVDPTPSVARQVVGDLAEEMELDPVTVDNLRLGVSEVLGNAVLHGVRPVVVHAWSRPGRVVVSIEDAGRGPVDPFVGLLPANPGTRTGGLGLWITHQLCPETALSRSRDGFTVRLAAGAPDDDASGV